MSAMGIFQQLTNWFRGLRVADDTPATICDAKTAPSGAHAGTFANESLRWSIHRHLFHSVGLYRLDRKSHQVIVVRPATRRRLCGEYGLGYFEHCGI
jgi:hypothetical protein